MKGKGKFDPMMKGMPPMMMKGKPPFGMPGMPFDPMKGLPMPPKGMGPKGFKGMPPMPPKGKGYPGMGDLHKESLDTQRFATERKRRVREFAGALNGRIQDKENSGISEEKLQKTKDFQDAIGLQLEGHQLPVLSS